LAASDAFVGSYERASRLADRALAAAERMGDRRLAAEALMVKAHIGGLHGRMWEARALFEGARKLAEEAGLTAVSLRASNNLAFEVALDDPVAAVAFQREGLAL